MDAMPKRRRDDRVLSRLQRTIVGRVSPHHALEQPMTTLAAPRVRADRVSRVVRRQEYGRAHRSVGRLGRLASPVHLRFAAVALKSQVDFMRGRLNAVPGQTRERMQAAAAWLLRAQDATPDDGVSLGYFPFHRGAGTSGWLPSYPETTGYIIPSLLQYAGVVRDASITERARRMAVWETTIQMPSGAVQAGPVCPSEQRQPSVFNTGMVLQGYVALLLEQNDDRILEGARHAADFLIGDMDEDGHFRTHGPFVAADRVKTYSCLCAWPLYRFGQLVGDKRYVEAAVRAVEAAVGEQAANGWFAHNCLTRPAAPLTHTIGYTMQGILEVGFLAGRADFVAAVERAARPLLARIAPSGFLHGRYDADWKPASSSSCLTGSAQIAGVFYRLFEHGGDSQYREGAERVVDCLKGLQILDSSNPGVHGGLAGSFPILGEYMTGGYPNWATKYFLDALMLQERGSKSR
jgi:hypothetical protein